MRTRPSPPLCSIALGVMALFMTTARCCLAETRQAERIAIGTKIKSLEFKDIRYLPRSIEEFGKMSGFVFVFTNTTCPLVQRYWPRLKSLSQKYARQGIQFVSINSTAGDSIKEIAAQAIEYEVLFPFVKDRSGECAKLLGVTRTPQVVLLDGQYRIVYRGRIDDQYRFGGTRPTAQRHDLQEAIDELLAGKDISVAETTVDGCEITFRQRQLGESASHLTFVRDIAPLVKEHCATCHRGGTAAPFSLTTYEEVKKHRQMIAEVVDEGRMPPWYASQQYGKFQNDRSLTSKHRKTIVDWVRAGARSGDLTQLKQPLVKPSQDGWQIGQPDLILTTLTPELLPSEGFIPYKYTVLPHVFTLDTWIEAIEIKPTNRRVVHHANLAYGGPNTKPGLRTFLTGYVPGGQAMDLSHFDNGVALRIPALSLLGLQIHYTTTGKPEQCQIQVGIRYARRPVQKRLRFRLLDPRFRIEPQHPAFPVKASARLDQDATLLGMFCHMHLRGKDMTFLAHQPNKKKQTLLQIPNYSFDWQHGYEIKAGDVRLAKGTRLEAVAHYDNSPFNPYNPDPSKTVRYGPQTIHEMMNAYMFFTFDEEKLDLRVNPKTGWEIKR